MCIDNDPLTTTVSYVRAKDTPPSPFSGTVTVAQVGGLWGPHRDDIVPDPWQRRATPAKRFITKMLLCLGWGRPPLLRTLQNLVCWRVVREIGEIPKLIGRLEATRLAAAGPGPARPTALASERAADHTSDWHLGRAFHGVGDAARPGSAKIDHLVEVVRTERVDAVRRAATSTTVPCPARPPWSSEAVTGSSMRGPEWSCRRGNHDSRSGWGSRPASSSGGLHIRTSLASVVSPVVVDGVAVYRCYLEPSTSAEPLAAAERTTPESSARRWSG